MVIDQVKRKDSYNMAWFTRNHMPVEGRVSAMIQALHKGKDRTYETDMTDSFNSLDHHFDGRFRGGRSQRSTHLFERRGKYHHCLAKL